MRSINILRSVFVIAIAAAINSSCTEKINLKLNNSEPKVVIEGNISDEPGPYFVGVTKSRLYSDSNILVVVPSALVIISDDAGNADTLTETAFAGLYQTNFIQGTIGRTYKLSVTAEGTTYVSICKMQAPVDIDSIVLSAETQFNGDLDNEADIEVRDPFGVVNYYRVVSYTNGKRSTGFSVHRDRLWDGKLRSFNVPDDDYEVGDTLRVDLWSIDEHVYTYFDQFDQNQNNFGAPAAPANPDAIFTPATLGYFSAHSVKSKTVIIP